MLISCQSTRWLSTLTAPRLATVLVTLHCTNDCVFCGAAEQRQNRQSPVLPTSDVEAWLRRCAAAGVRLIAFSGAGDPLGHPDFLSFVQTAVALGMSPYVYTQAHGLQRKSVEAMVDAGMHEMAISVHGATPFSHDRATRQPESFERSLAGLKIALDAGLRVQTNSVITRLNAAETDALVDLLAGRMGVQEMAFSYPRMEGNAWKHRQLFLSYAEAADAIRPCLARLRAMGKDATVENIPPCHLAPTEYTPLPDYEVMYKDDQNDLCIRPSQVEMNYPSDCERCERRVTCPGIDCGYPFEFAAGPHRACHPAPPQAN